MKIRNGFVSNSSSSSFCVFGINIEFESIVSLAKDLGIDDEIIDNYVEYADYDLDGDDYDSPGVLSSEITKKTGLSCECTCGEEPRYFYIGKYPETLKDEETGEQFKEPVVDFVSKYFDKKKPEWICEEMSY